MIAVHFFQISLFSCCLSFVHKYFRIISPPIIIRHAWSLFRHCYLHFWGTRGSPANRFTYWRKITPKWLLESTILHFISRVYYVRFLSTNGVLETKLIKARIFVSAHLAFRFFCCIFRLWFCLQKLVKATTANEFNGWMTSKHVYGGFRKSYFYFNLT